MRHDFLKKPSFGHHCHDMKHLNNFLFSLLIQKKTKMGKVHSKSPTDHGNQLNENEKYNLHLRHHLVREIFNGNFSSPVHNILTGWSARVLHVKLVDLKPFDRKYKKKKFIKK